MADVNSVVVTGRLVRDALFKQSGGYDILEFDIAVNGWKKEDVQFFKCTLFGKQAIGIRQYMLKGKQVGVMGSIKTNKWTDRDGMTHKDIGIGASSVTLLSDGTTTVTAVKEDKHDDRDEEIVVTF
jgi:single-strand DNA-binding protein